MLSDVYSDAASFLKEGIYYFENPQAQAFNYSEKQKTRLKLYTEIILIESELFDCLGIDRVSSLKVKSIIKCRDTTHYLIA